MNSRRIMSVCSGRGKMSQKNVCRVDFGEIYVSVQNIPISTWIRFANYIIHILVYIGVYISGRGGGRSNTHLPPFHNQKLWIFVEIFSQKLFKIFSAISWSSFRIPPLSQFAVSEHHQLPDIPLHQILVAIAFN